MELETTTGMLLTLEQYNALQSRLAALERERDIWMNVYPGGHFVLWPTKEIAEDHCQNTRIALVHLRMVKGAFVPFTFMPESDSQSDAEAKLRS